MYYRAEKDQKRVISWVTVMVILGIILVGLGPQSNFYYLLGLLLILGSSLIFINRKKAIL